MDITRRLMVHSLRLHLLWAPCRVVLATVLLSSGAFAAGDSWRKVAPHDFVFSVQLPGKITTTQSTQPTFVGTARTIIHRATRGETSFAVSRTELPKRASWLVPKALLLRRARDNFLKETNGIERSFAPIERNGIAGKKLRYEEGSRFGSAELYMVGGQLITIASSHPKSVADHDYQRFFSSLEMNVEHCRPSPKARAGRTMDEDEDSKCKVDTVLIPAAK